MYSLDKKATLKTIIEKILSILLTAEVMFIPTPVIDM